MITHNSVHILNGVYIYERNVLHLITFGNWNIYKI